MMSCLPIYKLIYTWMLQYAFDTYMNGDAYELMLVLIRLAFFIWCTSSRIAVTTAGDYWGVYPLYGTLFDSLVFYGGPVCTTSYLLMERHQYEFWRSFFRGEDAGSFGINSLSSLTTGTHIKYKNVFF